MLYRSFDPYEFPNDEILSKAGIGEWCEFHGLRKTSNKNARLPISLWNRGFHLMEVEVIINWLGNEIYEMEYDVNEEYEEHQGIIVARKARKTKQANWNEKIARQFAIWCAEQVKYLNEESDAVISVIKDFNDGKITESEKDEVILTNNIDKYDTSTNLAIGAAYLSGDKNAYLAAQKSSTVAVFAEFKSKAGVTEIRKKQIDYLSLILEGKEVGIIEEPIEGIKNK
jgi:hypothetical protein